MQELIIYYRGVFLVKKTKQLFAGLILLVSGLGTLQAAEECPSKLMEGSVCLPKGFAVEPTPGGYTLNLTEGHTQISHDVYGLHMLILWICVLVGIGVFGTMFYSIYHHRKSKGHVAEQFHENTTVEIIWTIIPALILLAMAIPATKTMIEMDGVEESDMTIKVTGWQWKWEYEYLGNDIRFFSSLDHASNMARQLDSNTDPRSVAHYLLRVDEPLVIPVNKKIRFVFTAADVLHSWWVPDLGWKKDAIPGFINEAWASVDEPGIYRGQCTELCGRDHAFMPVVVIAMEQEDYDAWATQKHEQECKAKGSADMPHDDLVAKGAEIYEKNCSTCHMPDGGGIAGAFPALRGSAVVNGDINAQATLILNGKNAMPAFGKQLSATELASVITYTRNALGNAKGDEIQPKAIKAKLPKSDDDDDGCAAKPAKTDKDNKPAKAEVTDKAEEHAQKPAEAPVASKKAVTKKAVEKHEESIPATKPASKSSNSVVEPETVSKPKLTGSKPNNKNDARELTQHQAKALAQDSSANADLISAGQTVFETNCSSCHQKDGGGMPPVFPALTGSAIVKGDIKAQANLVMKGKGSMPAFGGKLTPAELAQVITYTRNALGNANGDSITADQIQKLMQGKDEPTVESSVAPESPANKVEEKDLKAEDAKPVEDKNAESSDKTESVANDEQVAKTDEAKLDADADKEIAAKANEANDKTKETADDEAAVVGEKTLDELVAQGESVYEKNCQSCHQPEGVGMPPVFPALKGSAVVTGAIDAQIEIMLKGKGVMPAFGKTLSALDFASVLAFTRNKLGNSTGDFKQPSEIEALQLAK
jgi:cytochrome c oxidase subunit II